MVFHIVDCDLLKEWVNTCGEYFGLILKPFSKMGIKEIWSCNQSNLEDWFTTWSVIQFWWALIVNIVAFILIAILADSDQIGNGVRGSVGGIISAYIWAHLGWFAVTKKHGCCCCVLVCMSEAPCLLLLYGLWLLLWGALIVVNSIAWIDLFDLGFLVTVLVASYGIPLLYMGSAMIKMWCQKKNEPQLGNTGTTIVGKASA